MRYETSFSEMTANPRFLDRLNAVCTVFLVLILVSLLYLTLQSRALDLPQSQRLQSAVEAVHNAPVQNAGADRATGARGEGNVS